MKRVNQRDLLLGALAAAALFVNTTTMFHPVHLHGHTFATGDAAGPRKDTAIVLPGKTLPVFFDADNPGLWIVHCHNVYHAEACMMAVLGFRQKG